MEDNLSVMSLWGFIGNLPIDKLSVNITSNLLKENLVYSFLNNSLILCFIS